MDVNEVILSMTDWQIATVPRKSVGYSGENEVVKFAVITTPDEDFTYYLDIKYKKIKNTVLLTSESDRVSVTLTADMLGEAGIKKMQIRAYSDTQIKKSNIFEIEVGESINAVEEVEGTYASALNQIAQWFTNVFNTLSGKQDKLIAGQNITIEDNVISASGGGGESGDSDLLVVTYYRPTNTTWACDKTYEEMVSAYNSGKKIYPVYRSLDYRYFTEVTMNYEQGVEFRFQLIWFDSSITRSYLDLHHSAKNEVITGSIITSKLQRQLTAGDGISISGNTISVSYDNGDTEVY